jgi:hypothetical protein
MPEPEPLEDADDLGGDTDVGFAYSAAETRSFTPQAGHVAVAARASADDDPAESEERYPEDSERDDWFYQETDEGALASAYGDEAGDYDGPGYMALDDTAPPAAAVPSAQPLTIEDKRQIIEQIARSESGKARYGAINSDGEFKGRFGPGHPAYQRYHIGISYGIVQFTQDSGMLGRLLQLMFERDPETFRATFGPQAGELLRTTTTAGPSSREQPDGRSARVQPVGGADLWEEPWLTRFRQAAEHVSFQAAQNQLAASAFLDPILQFAAWLGLDTDRALTIVVDRAVQMGLDGARRWIIDAVGPIQTAALRQQALSALGKTDLRSFQAATLGLVADDQWGPLTHAAMVAALQQLGSGSPIPIPTRDQMLNAIVRRAADTPWAERAARLRSSPEFRDVVYQLP